MKPLKKIQTYISWLILSIPLSMLAVIIELKYTSKIIKGYLALFKQDYHFIIMALGSVIGVISFLVFKGIDSRYISRKALKKRKHFMLRIFTLLVLISIITSVHYILKFKLKLI